MCSCLKQEETSCNQLPSAFVIIEIVEEEGNLRREGRTAIVTSGIFLTTFFASSFIYLLGYGVFRSEAALEQKWWPHRSEKILELQFSSKAPLLAVRKQGNEWGYPTFFHGLEESRNASLLCGRKECARQTKQSLFPLIFKKKGYKKSVRGQNTMD